MIIELNQFIDLLYGNFHALILHFIVFVLFACLIKKLFSFKYKPYVMSVKESHKLSVIVPVYNEIPNILERCLQSIRYNNPDELIVVIDRPTLELEQIANKYANITLVSQLRKGKRKAIVTGIKESTGDIIILVDSDVILDEHCLEELIKPFNNKAIAAVSTVHDTYPTGNTFGGYLSWQCSRLIERNREVNDKALNGHLVVVDGKCNAYRRSVLINYLDDFLNEKYFDKPCQIGDDRYFTYRLNHDKWESVVQSGARITTASPNTLKGFLKQQLRWARSGRKFFLKEIKTNLFSKVGIIYPIHSSTFYLSSLSFTVALFLDMFWCIDLGLRYPWWAIFVFVPAGSAMVNMIRQIIILGKKANLSNSLWYGIIGLFILYPLNLYAWLTFKNQSIWLTRGEEMKEIGGDIYEKAKYNMV